MRLILPRTACIAGLLALLSEAPALAQDAFYNKTFFVTFRVGKDPTAFRFYVSSSGTVYAYSNSGGDCGNTGGVAKIGVSQTTTYYCTNLNVSIAQRVALTGTTMTVTQTTRANKSAPTIYRQSCSYDGQVCKAVEYVMDNKESFRPLSCEVKAGNTISAVP